MVKCCCTTGCVVDEPIDPGEPEDAVRLQCTDGSCAFVLLMHRVCFAAWLRRVVDELHAAVDARLKQPDGLAGKHGLRWALPVVHDEPQLVRRFWSKKEPHLKLCTCMCRRGQLRVDQNHFNAVATILGHEAAKAVQSPATSSTEEDEDGGASAQKQPLSGGPNGAIHQPQPRHNQPPARSIACRQASPSRAQHRRQQRAGPRQNSLRAVAPPSTLAVGQAPGRHQQPPSRSRTVSLGSTAGGDQLPQQQFPGGRPGRRQSTRVSDSEGFFGDVQVQNHGSIFKPRSDLAAFMSVLPRWKINGYHIKLEDECPQGNDDTRIFLLTTLGTANKRQLQCVLCSADMSIYDRYPLVDGALFVSPLNHKQLGVPVRYDGKESFLHAVCVWCCECRSYECGRCGDEQWYGSTMQHLVYGGLYGYDVLSAVGCCTPHCSRCAAPLPLPSAPGDATFGCRPGFQRNFSTFTEQSVCPRCGARAAHYIRRADEVRPAQTNAAQLRSDTDALFDTVAAFTGQPLIRQVDEALRALTLGSVFNAGGRRSDSQSSGIGSAPASSSCDSATQQLLHALDAVGVGRQELIDAAMPLQQLV